MKAEYKKKILAVLDGPGGYLTKDVAIQVSPIFGHNHRTHSAAIRVWLLELEKEGLVTRLDDQKPVVWSRV